MESYYSCGGTVWIGRRGITAHWPWGRLEASPTMLSISAPVFGQFVFAPEDVLGLDRFNRIPILHWGVGIRHIRKDIPWIVRFTNLAGPGVVLRGIESTGFLPRAVERTSCLKCGAVMSAESDSCPKCGWSYATSGRDEA
jgi:hypothetical protein